MPEDNSKGVTGSKAEKPVARPAPIPVYEEPRVGGQWNGRVRIAKDFDSLPDDVAAAFGLDAE